MSYHGNINHLETCLCGLQILLALFGDTDSSGVFDLDFLFFNSITMALCCRLRRIQAQRHRHRQTATPPKAIMHTHMHANGHTHVHVEIRSYTCNLQVSVDTRSILVHSSKRACKYPGASNLLCTCAREASKLAFRYAELTLTPSTCARDASNSAST